MTPAYCELCGKPGTPATMQALPKYRASDGRRAGRLYVCVACAMALAGVGRVA